MKSLNYWPWMIAGIFATVVSAIIITLYLALEKPLEYDPFFGGDHSYVKEHYPKILSDSQEFDRLYELNLLGELQDGQNTLSIRLTSKAEGSAVSDAGIKALFTRPATTDQDIDLGSLEQMGDFFRSAPFNLWAKGIWRLELLVTVEDLKVSRSFEFEYPID